MNADLASMEFYRLTIWSRFQSVRRKSKVAAPMVNTVNTVRKARS